MTTRTAARRPAIPAMSERDLEAAVVKLCEWLHIKRFHPYISRKSSPGWPDEALCGRRGLLIRELKSETGKVTKAQQEWLDALQQAGVDADVWRPADLRSGRIKAELEAIR